MSKLLPCPFCNETPHIDVQKGHRPQARFSYYREHVVCACGASTKLFKAPGKAVAAWNTRPTPAPCDELVTIGYVHRGTAGLLMEGAVSKAVIIPKAGGDFKHAVVFSENAEAVIEAKDARIAELEADNNRLRKRNDATTP